jgi:uncharacterized SAM-binding protein YcdF (DUF218 family)
MARALPWLRRMVLVGAAVWGVTALALTGFAALAPPMIAAAPMPADAIVVLGGGAVSEPGRVARGAALFDAGMAPALHLTSAPASAGRMAALAAGHGIPPAALSIERGSHSTLQNALFSQPALAGAGHVVLVTEAWHLPRAWASFGIAGNQRRSLAFSVRFGPDAARLIAREAAATWFNVGRAAIWAVAGTAGVPRAWRDRWLR